MFFFYKNDHFGVFSGVPPFKETPIWLPQKMGMGDPTFRQVVGGIPTRWGRPTITFGVK